MKKTIAVAVAAFAGLAMVSSAAHAQDPAPTPRARELAAQIIDALGGERNLDSARNALAEQLISSFPKVPGMDAAKSQAELLSFARDETERFSAKILEIKISIYAKNFSESQLSDILMFYRSATGAEVGKKLLTIYSEYGRAYAPIAKIMQRDLSVKYCSLSKCSKAQYTQIEKQYSVEGQ